MNHQDKVDHLIADVTGRGAWKSTVAPPWFALLWRCGVEVPPLPFLSLPQMVLWAGLPFGLAFSGISLWAYGGELRPDTFLIRAGVSGLLFAGWLWVAMRYVRRRYGLPDSWNEYTGQA